MKSLLRSLPGFKLGMILCLLACPPLQAGMLGDAAPELQVREWIQGGPLNLKDRSGSEIYVIEFWQTECPHCLESLPYLSALQEQYKPAGVVFIGISGEDAATLRTFLKGNQTAGYALAVDDEDKTYAQYMGAFGVSGVPHAFIIGRQGRVLWEGHPMDDLEEVLEEVVSGRYNLIEKQQVARARKLLSVYMYLLVETDEADLARGVGDRVYTYGRNNSALLDELGRFIMTSEEVKTPDLDLAYRAAKRACELTGETDGRALALYAVVLERMGAAEEAGIYRAKADRMKGETGADRPQPAAGRGE